ncbi:MAG TPA: hypothetical protein VF717_09335 [Pyrinomonadaceae bacterium]
MPTVRNMTLQTIMLEDGTLIGAAGHDGSEKTVQLSESDRRRFVDTEMLMVLPERQKKEAAPPKEEGTPAPEPAPLTSSGSSTASPSSSQQRPPSTNNKK